MPNKTPGRRRVEIEMDEDVYRRMDALRRLLGRSMRDEVQAACERHLSAPPEPPPPPVITTPPLPTVKRGRGRPRKVQA